METTQTINEVTYTIREVDGRKLRGRYGSCDNPRQPDPEIWIRKNMADVKKVEILLHEMIHAAWFSIDEDDVDRVAKDMVKALVALGLIDAGKSQ